MPVGARRSPAANINAADVVSRSAQLWISVVRARASSRWAASRSSTVARPAARYEPALDDQATAGVMMWIPGSVIFLVAAAWLAIEMLGGARTAPGPVAVGAVHRAGRARSS
jgi:hypothetical protein